MSSLIDWLQGHWIKLVGVYFAVEGGANLIYWYLYGGGVADNNFWQVGRALRLIFGIALIIFG